MNETKEHILKTSLALFLQKSYRDVTMKEIVQKTGLSKGAFYHYFESKEELFKEITQLFMSSGIIDYSAFPKSSLKDFYRTYVDYIGESFKGMFEIMNIKEKEKASVNFFFIMFEAIGRFPEFLDFELKQYNDNIKEWVKVIDTAKRTGEIKSSSSSRKLADLFLYCTDGVFIRFANSNKQSAYEKDLLDAFNTIYDNLKT